jgi:hypothetical protein
MEDDLVFNGQRYISSARAAKLVGYTKDYVGQLCRAEKIEARLVGRSWYVNEDSIRKHKLGVNYTLHQPIKARKAHSKQEAAVAHPRDSKSVTVRYEPVRRRVRENVEAQSVRPNSVPHVRVMNDSPSDHVHVTRSSVHDIHADEARHRQYEVLGKSDIRYETGTPLFYEDDRPVIPEPVKMTRFEGVPIVTHTKPRDMQHRPRDMEIYRGNEISTTTHHATRSNPASRVSIDGVLPSRPSVRTHKRPARNRVSQGPVDDFLDMDTDDALSDEYVHHKGTKLIPVLGAIAVIVIVVVVWLLGGIG